MTQTEITKIGNGRYDVFADNETLHIDEEDIDEPKLMGMTGLTSQEILERLDLEPVGHKIIVNRR